MISAVRIQLVVTTLLFGAAALFAGAAQWLNEIATGWTAWSIWTALLGLLSVAAAVGPWLWAQTVRGQRVMIGTVLIGSGAGLLALLPGLNYSVALAAQLALIALVIAEAGPARAVTRANHGAHEAH